MSTASAEMPTDVYGTAGRPVGEAAPASVRPSVRRPLPMHDAAGLRFPCRRIMRPVSFIQPPIDDPFHRKEKLMTFFSAMAKRLAAKSVSEVTYFVSSETLSSKINK